MNRARVAFVSTVVACLVAGACGGDESGEAAAASASVVTTASPEPSTTVPPSTTTTVPVTTLVDADDPACLIGSWVIDEAEMNDFYDTVGTHAGRAMGEEEFTFDLGLTGQATLTLDGQTFVYEMDFDVTIDVAGLVGEGSSTGSFVGTYTVDGGIIETVVETSDAELLVDVGGMTMTGDDLAMFLHDGVPLDGAGYDCDGPTIDLQASPDPALRHTVTLTPA